MTHDKYDAAWRAWHNAVDAFLIASRTHRETTRAADKAWSEAAEAHRRAYVAWLALRAEQSDDDV